MRHGPCKAGKPRELCRRITLLVAKIRCLKCVVPPKKGKNVHIFFAILIHILLLLQIDPSLKKPTGCDFRTMHPDSPKLVLLHGND